VTATRRYGRQFCDIRANWIELPFMSF